MDPGYILLKVCAILFKIFSTSCFVTFQSLDYSVEPKRIKVDSQIPKSKKIILVNTDEHSKGRVKMIRKSRRKRSAHLTCDEVDRFLSDPGNV